MSLESTIKYTNKAVLTPEALSRLFQASGIKRPYDDLPRIQRMIDCADITYTAWASDQLVGVARAITDFSYCCYLSDLAVDKDYQKQGIGKNLVSLLQDQLGDQVALILLSAPNAMEYYPQLGFNTIRNGFIIPRKK
ncbi:GNAT superfamily N-acetyltransferase [Lederbergia galactosidilyticus]|uniref:GNAT family N-acetyltransferase n=1 Tax=Lederbergia galactosidilytica TaxID=217031 RepID=UPI001AE4AFCA|nr:GNAT family N-acetyltransferase [Lederbergia galactosidilytica]MBP1914538.1 GNAT superfamily N-acetyltransferase [Lederbergia galactosidilytica]